jgi:hypothetical protein
LCFALEFGPFDEILPVIDAVCWLVNFRPEKVVRGAHVKTHKLLQVCKQVVTSLFTSCRQVVFALLVPHAVVVTSLEQAVNNL